jgi:hypothetical protein
VVEFILPLSSHSLGLRPIYRGSKAKNQWRLLRGGRLIIMDGMESMERHQPHGNHVFDVFNIIPLTPFQPLL